MSVRFLGDSGFLHGMYVRFHCFLRCLVSVSNVQGLRVKEILSLVRW